MNHDRVAHLVSKITEAFESIGLHVVHVDPSLNIYQHDALADTEIHEAIFRGTASLEIEMDLFVAPRAWDVADFHNGVFYET